MSRLVMTGAAEAMAVRFAWSPLWETTHAVRTLRDERTRPYHRSWHRLVAARLDRIDLGPLLAVQPRRGFVPDFLTPPPRTASPRVRDQLAEVRATPLDQVQRELRRCRQSVGAGPDADILDALLGDPARARELLSDLLYTAWMELVAPFWIRVRTLLERDIQARTRLLARRGMGPVIDELHPRVRWTQTGLSVGDGGRATVTVGSRGLLLMPSAFLWPAVAAVIDEPWQPTIAYPARGIAELWRTPSAPPEALGRLIGRTRALILSSLDHPSSTQAVAAHLGLSPAGVSGHLIALRDAGLCSPERHGHQVLYRRTRLGTSLLHGS